SEMELKKILIEKMEGNKSIQRSDEQRTLYKALVDAYEADKAILDTYGEDSISTTVYQSVCSCRGTCADDLSDGGNPTSGGSCSSLTELEYHLEEVYKATTDQLDWVNPERSTVSSQSAAASTVDTG
nr:hypothetical protein [Tanacetum cinerariifolium]